MSVDKNDFNHLVELYNRRIRSDVIGVSYEEQVALGRVIDALQNGRPAWAVQMDGEPFSLWLTEGAARSVLAAYQRSSKAKWDIVQIEVTRLPVGGQQPQETTAHE